MNWGASNFSPMVDGIALFLLGVSSLLVLVVLIALIFFCIKYRKGSKADRSDPPQRPGPFEFSISAVIFIFGLSLFIWSSDIFYKMYLPPKDAKDIYVVAKQWMWIFHTPQGLDQINTLRVPLGKPVRLIMTSQDVIHSFYVPDFRIKQDVLPGRYTSLWFIAEKLGHFPILCSKYCGLSHSQMLGVIDVVPAEEYETPIENSSESLNQIGARLFVEKGCTACHGADHQIGPSLANIYTQTIALANGQKTIADENYIRRHILTPGGEIVAGYSNVMPPYQGQLSEDELLALVAYIKEKKE